MSTYYEVRWELDSINSAIYHLTNYNVEELRKTVAIPFIPVYPGFQGGTADTNDESEVDIVIVSGTAAFHVPSTVQKSEIEYEKIHAICKTVERAHVIRYEIPKIPESLGDEALRLLDYLASLRACRVLDSTISTDKTCERRMFMVGAGVGATLIKQCLLQSRVSFDPIRALIWTAVHGIFLLDPITRNDLIRWQTAKPPTSSAKTSVRFSALTWRDVRDIELEYDAVASHPATYRVNLPSDDEWTAVLHSLETAATPEDTKPVQRLRHMKQTLSEWRTSKRRPPPKTPKLVSSGKMLLSLDGGGLKGVSSLMLLEYLMAHIARREAGTDRRTRRPVDYFDLAGGTSTGGLIAILLFRLRMDVPTALAMYEQLGKDIFEPNPLAKSAPKLSGLTKYLVKPYTGVRWLAGGATYGAGALEDAVDRILTERGEIRRNHGRDVKLWDPRTRISCSPEELSDQAEELSDQPQELSDQNAEQPDGRGAMFVCATLHDEQRGIRFRTYETKADVEASRALDANSNYDGRPIRSPEKTLRTTITIKDAVRATSAAPTYFPEKVMDGYRFWDGGLLNNNPVDQVWAARNDLDDRPVACLLSVGASYADNLAQSSHLLNLGLAVTEYATNTESKHRDFEEKWKSLQSSRRRSFLYARLNVPTGHDQIAMDKIEHMELLKHKTKEYLKTYSARSTINQLTSILSKPRASSRSSPVHDTEDLIQCRIGNDENPSIDVRIVPGSKEMVSPGFVILGAKHGWWQLPQQRESAQSSMIGAATTVREVRLEFDICISVFNGIYEEVTDPFKISLLVNPSLRLSNQEPVDIQLSESTVKKIRATKSSHVRENRGAGSWV